MGKTPTTINTGNAAAAAQANRPAPTTTPASTLGGDPDVGALMSDDGGETIEHPESDDISAQAHENTRHANPFWRHFCIENVTANPRAYIALAKPDARIYSRERNKVKLADTKKLADIFLPMRDPMTGRPSSLYTRASFKAVQPVGQKTQIEFSFLGSGASGASAIVTQDEPSKEARAVFYKFMRAFYKKFITENPDAARRAAQVAEEDLLDDLDLASLVKQQAATPDANKPAA